jgi:hypothetical protein
LGSYIYLKTGEENYSMIKAFFSVKPNTRQYGNVPEVHILHNVAARDKAALMPEKLQRTIESCDGVAY